MGAGDTWAIEQRLKDIVEVLEEPAVPEINLETLETKLESIDGNLVEITEAIDRLGVTIASLVEEMRRS